MHQPFVAQKAKRVIDGGKTDARQPPARRVKDLGGGGMVITRLDHFQHHLALPGQGHRRRFALLPGHVWNYNNSKLDVKRARRVSCPTVMAAAQAARVFGSNGALPEGRAGDTLGRANACPTEANELVLSCSNDNSFTFEGGITSYA